MDYESTKSLPGRREQVRHIFDEFSSRELYAVEEPGKVSSDDRLVIAAVCRRPEFRPLLQGIRFSVTDTGSHAFLLESGNEVAIGRGTLACPSLAAFHLRHALEILMLKSRLDGLDTAVDLMALAIAAFHTALQYLDDMIDEERHAVLAALPAWITEVASTVSGCGQQRGLVSHRLKAISSVIEKLLPLQAQAFPGIEAPVSASHSDSEQAIERAQPLVPLLCPTERLLTVGGDTRLVIDRKTGLNTYGCSSRPRPWAVTFSSCTSSSISDMAYQEAEFSRQAMISGAWKGSLVQHCEEEGENIRAGIAAVLELDQVPGTQVVLTPSGTDGELYVLYLAMGEDASPVHNILISSTEIGSGTAYAAGGQHFDALTPLGRSVEQGQPVEGFPKDCVELSVLELRHKDGQLRTMKELDKAVEEQTEAALASGRRVLIHLLDCSKTGIGAPSFEIVKKLRRAHPNRIDVMVDAAQMRVAHGALHRYLEEGFIVLISASKFFTGPPFAGALLIPPQVTERVPGLRPLPTGFADYSTPYEFPSEWRRLTTGLRREANLGLLLRWRAGFWEMNAFHSVSALDQFNTINTFGTEIMQMISTNPDLELVMAPPHHRGHPGFELCWDQLPTIFTFIVYKDDPDRGRQPLGYEEARFAYRCINIDIARFLPAQTSDREYELARKRCHIGQPVRVKKNGGDWIGALRIAAGARLVAGAQFDDAFGATPAERLETEIRTASVVFGKLSLIVKYWDALPSSDMASGPTQKMGFHQF